MNNSGNTHPTTSPELLPCPFCGSRPTSTWFGGYESDEGYWGIDCPQTCAHSHEDDEETAVARWNTRQPQSPSTSEDALRKALERVVAHAIVYPDFEGSGAHLEALDALALKSKEQPND